MFVVYSGTGGFCALLSEDSELLLVRGGYTECVSRVDVPVQVKGPPAILFLISSGACWGSGECGMWRMRILGGDFVYKILSSGWRCGTT